MESSASSGGGRHPGWESCWRRAMIIGGLGHPDNKFSISPVLRGFQISEKPQ
jgi:hypothetical protein